MKNIVKEMTLTQINCPEEVFMNLERLHYEIISRERILALTLANESVNLEGQFKKYYEDYMATFKEYDQAKQDFYTTYLANTENIENCSGWEANFNTRSVIFYG